MSEHIKFYDLMKYPTPTYSHLYSYIGDKISTDQSTPHSPYICNTISNKEFSWNKKPELMDEYITYIDQRSWILRHIPCIRQVYLCNSITFNALHNNSDIDLCIITRAHYLRFARIFSWLAIMTMGLKRKKGKFNDNKKKICLSFYIDESQSDIYHLRKRQGDIYLSYWLAHTVLLYTDDTLSPDHLIKENSKLLSYLPSHPGIQSIYIRNSIITGSSYLKKTVEYIICNSIGQLIEKSIGWIRGTCILGYKKSQLSYRTQQEIIISSRMLKFHQDTRNAIQHRRKSTTINTK